MNDQKLKEKVKTIAGKLLVDKGYIAPVDLLMAMDLLNKKDYEAWRNGKVPYLERICRTNLRKLSKIMQTLKSYGRENKLKASQTVYMKWGKGKKTKLIFSKSGKLEIEQAYSTHYIQPRNKK